MRFVAFLHGINGNDKNTDATSLSDAICIAILQHFSLDIPVFVMPQPDIGEHLTIRTANTVKGLTFFINDRNLRT